MKNAMIACLFLLVAPAAHATTSYDDFTLSSLSQPNDINQVIKDVTRSIVAQDPEVNVIVGYQISAPEAVTKEFRVLGLTQKEALEHAGDIRPGVTIACNDAHLQGDIANRWCHSMFTKMYTANLEARGVPKGVASVIGATLFVPKEYLVDLHPSADDMQGIYWDKFSKTSRMGYEVAVFGDRKVFFTLTRDLGPRVR